MTFGRLPAPLRVPSSSRPLRGFVFEAKRRFIMRATRFFSSTPWAFMTTILDVARSLSAKCGDAPAKRSFVQRRIGDQFLMRLACVGVSLLCLVAVAAAQQQTGTKSSQGGASTSANPSVL